MYLYNFTVLAAVVMKSCIFWDITPCSPLKIKRRFGGTCRLFQGRIIAKHETSMKQVASRALHGVISQNVELFIL
jgi:hypothetical protein